MQFDHSLKHARWARLHIVPTRDPKAGETWISETRVWVTRAREHPFHVEWLRFAEDSPVAEHLRTRPHVAYRVGDLDRRLEGRRVVLGPFVTELGDRVAFVETEDGALVEFMAGEGDPR